MRRPSDRRSRPHRASTPAKSLRRRASVRRAPTHPMRAARSEYDAPSVRTADASDIGPQHPARDGQNDCEIVLNRKNALFAGSDQGAENWAVVASLDRNLQTVMASIRKPTSPTCSQRSSISASHQPPRRTHALGLGSTACRRSPRGVIARATRVRAQSNKKIKPSEQCDRKIAYGNLRW